MGSNQSQNKNLSLNKDQSTQLGVSFSYWTSNDYAPTLLKFQVWIWIINLWPGKTPREIQSQRWISFEIVFLDSEDPPEKLLDPVFSDDASISLSISCWSIFKSASEISNTLPSKAPISISLLNSISIWDSPLTYYFFSNWSTHKS